MTTVDVVYLQDPTGIDPSADLLHPPPQPEPALWGDTMWVSAIDPAAGIVGVNHIYATNGGFARFQCHYWIDGVQQSHCRRAPIVLDPSVTSWSDGFMTYEVVEPLRKIRLTMDGPAFGFDLLYEAKFPAFDYNDCAGGNPLWVLEPVAGHHGGHFEQALTCRGTFEIRGGPAAGETRPIDCLGHRDRTWSNRFSEKLPWDMSEVKDAAMHFWLILMFPDRDLHGFGFFDPVAIGLEDKGNGRRGYDSTARGNRRVLDVSPVPEYDGNATALRWNGPQRWRFVLDGGEVLHVRATKKYGTAKLWMRGDNDAENHLDDYEDIVDLEIEETGERGYGIIEYSVFPGSPRWSL